MAKHLIAFGHGNGDSGAVANGKTEAVEIRRLEPYLKEWAKKSKHDFSFYKGNLFADRAMKNQTSYDSVTELHLDAPSGNGGHVIVYKDYKPDNIDKRLRDVIEDHFGIVGYLQSANGFSYRNNLYNINQSAQHGINYRLLELFFLSNDEDYNYYIANLDVVAKDMIEAITGESLDGSVNVSTTIKKPTNEQKQASKSIEQLAQEVINGNYGSGDARNKALGNQYQVVQNRVNEILLGTSKPKAKPKVKSIYQLAQEVIDGKHGSGDARKRALGSRYNEVQNRVNQMLGVSSRKTTKQLADEVEQGLHGNGDARKRSLGSRYAEVQREINRRYS